MNTDSDDLLFYAMAGNDQKAFEKLFQKYYAALCDYVLIYMDTKSEAEDVVQDIFVYLWKNRTSIHLQESIKSYLYAMVRNRALNLLKHKAVERHHHPLLAEYLTELLDFEDREEEEKRLERLRTVIAELPEQCRIVFRRSCLDGKKIQGNS